MDIWSEVLSSISKKLTKPSFETWLANTTAEFKDDIVLVKAQNDFQADWIDVRYKSLISKTIQELTGKSLEIEVVIADADAPKSYERLPSQKRAENSRNTYDELKSQIKAQQKKIEELEGRIYQLEQAEK